MPLVHHGEYDKVVLDLLYTGFIENNLKQGAVVMKYADSENIFFKGEFKDNIIFGKFLY